MLLARMRVVLVLMMACLPLSAWAEFDFDQVIERARTLSGKSYESPRLIPKFMRELSYDAYQNIRFDQEQRLWRESNSRFQVMLVPPGLFYTQPVDVNIIDAEGVHRLGFEKARFTFSDPEIEKRIPADLGYAGFKLTYPLRGEDQVNQFVVFAGASYFRGVGRDDNFGISARGIAIDTGLASGEKFPAFTEFWLVRPAPDATSMMLYALLEGEGLTGAYRFQIFPGKSTRMLVDAVLFPRRNIELMGVAPLTSMFFYGENTTRPAGQWRPQVHDSDGLLIHNGTTDEWLWRPLLNPVKLEMDFFQTENVRGFGLLQRDNTFNDYQDLEAMYHSRPNTWVEPVGDWGKGEVSLIQLPTRNETNDNIVAFWHPTAPTEKGREYRFSYSLRFGPLDIAAHKLGKVVNTFVGHGDQLAETIKEGPFRFIVDFAQGDKLSKLPANAPVVARVFSSNNNEILEHYVEYNRPCKCWRLAILAAQPKSDFINISAVLSHEGDVLTETWNYRLPASNDLYPARK